MSAKSLDLTLERVEQHNAQTRAAASPKIQSFIDEVSTAVANEAALLDARIDSENKLRIWAKNLCGVALDISEIEELRDILSKMKSGETVRFYAKRGADVTLYKSALGTVDKLENYILTLEKAIIDLSQNKAPIPFNLTSIRVLQFTDLSTFGLIKLVFKRLFARSETNG